MSALVGAWTLARWDATLDGQPNGFPFGERAQGFLLYAADGWMSATLMRPGRAPLAHANFASGTDAEKARAAEGYVAYRGRWTLDGTTVRHAVQASLLPNWIGATLVREAAFQPDGKLLLTTPPERTRAGREVVNRLLWERAS